VSDQVTGNSIIFGTSGLRTITAQESTFTDSTSIGVNVGPVAYLTVTSSATSAVAGGSATLAAEGFDVSGDDLGDVTADTTFSSSNGSDQVTGTDVVFGASGARSIGASDGTARGETSVTVTDGALAHLVVASSVPSVTAGGSATITAEGFDAAGDDLGDVTGATTFTTSAPADTITGNTILFTTAGTDTVTAATGGVTATTDVTVAADAANPAVITLHVSDASVVRGGSITLHVTGVDGYGNPIAGLTDRTTFTSDWAVDVIQGSTITFPHASIHHITATLLGLTSTVAVTVIAPASVDLAFTGVDPTVSLTGALSALLLGLMVYYVSARRRGARSRSNSSRNLR
jgi:hypothetical protein